MTPAEWAAFSPREKDARVAELLGWRLYLAQWSDGPVQFAVPADFVLPKAPRTVLPWSEFNADFLAPYEPFLPCYSSEWGAAGPLLAKLRGDGWRWSLEDEGLPVADEGAETTCTIVKTFLEAVGASGPDSISLAFVMAKEAEAGA